MFDGLREVKFEEHIEKCFLKNKYIKTTDSDYNKDTALNENQLFEFITNSQKTMWDEYCDIKSNPKADFIKRLNQVINDKGLLYVLRKGINDSGKQFDLFYSKPEHSLGENSLNDYNSNIFSVSRQLHYSKFNNNSLDMVLFVNGFPIITLELKNQYTGKNIQNALTQYKDDRNPQELIFSFNKRSLIHFAVDNYEVSATSQLEGPDTYFLPFNQGSNGAGNSGGAGNPDNPYDFDSAYLWENILTKDSLSDIISKYLHKGKTKSGKDILIFPRYHQLDVVRKLVSNAKEKGPGENYLIEHSAGSGKSNSIAWLAYHLSSLFNKDNKKVFDSVIVVTHRKVLDKQLQNTISQFEKVKGTVVKVDKNSGQLRDAINDNKKIIISTLQKFPVIYKEIKSFNKSFAIICDEAHESQSGESARKLKEALGDKDLSEFTDEEIAEIEAKIEAGEETLIDELTRTYESQGKQENLSFFAFTATPKDKTLETFGEEYIEDGEKKYKAFHIYSMKQAIEEEFILDVLQHYTTCDDYFQLRKIVEDNPTIDKKEGLKAIFKLKELNKKRIEEKSKLIIDYFIRNTSQKIDKKAKAMVVCSSRKQAYDYYVELNKQVPSNLKNVLKILVAFSGELKIAGNTVTETSLNIDDTGNHISEDSLPKVFNGDNYKILVVADKYQTGFDEPLLHTMFVDKRLKDVKAVQTLSRLNRTCKYKEDTAVVDFVNDPEEIKKAFSKYYTETILSNETDKNIPFDLKTKLDDYNVYVEEDINIFIDYTTTYTEQEFAFRCQSLFNKIIADINKLDMEDYKLFRKTLSKFVSVYSYISGFFDLGMVLFEYNQFAKMLNNLLKTYGKKSPKPVKIDLDEKVILEQYKLVKHNEISIVLDDEAGEVTPITGSVINTIPQKNQLEEIIKEVNDKFNGGNWDSSTSAMIKDIHKRLLDPIINADMFNSARVNDPSNFRRDFKEIFQQQLLMKWTENPDLINNIINDANMFNTLSNQMARIIYNEIKEMI